MSVVLSPMAIIFDIIGTKVLEFLKGYSQSPVVRNRFVL
jgi:hypothetical protein